MHTTTPPLFSPSSSSSTLTSTPTGSTSLVVHLPTEEPVITEPSSPVWSPPRRTDVCFWDDTLVDIPIDGGNNIRADVTKSALLIIDMQNFFLHPEIRQSPLGLKCVEPIIRILPTLRSQGFKIVWVNWSLLKSDLALLPPSHSRAFTTKGLRGFGSRISRKFGRLLMRGSYNAELYPPLQAEYESGASHGTDFWINKNRMSGLWGYQNELGSFLKQHGITTLFFAGINADQCIPGTFVDAFYRGYDCVMLKDAVAPSNGAGDLQTMAYNAGTNYGFVTDTHRLLASMEQ